jgi:uncharacterized protein (TIGR03000 family)
MFRNLVISSVTLAGLLFSGTLAQAAPQHHAGSVHHAGPVFRAGPAVHSPVHFAPSHVHTNWNTAHHFNTAHYLGRPYYSGYRYAYPYTGYYRSYNHGYYPYSSYYSYPYSSYSYAVPYAVPYEVPYTVPYTVNNYVPVPVETTPAVPQQTTAIQVFLPSATAAVQIDGQTMNGTGLTRTLPVADTAATYTVTAIWLAGNRMLSESRTVAVTPGAMSVVDFTQ